MTKCAICEYEIHPSQIVQGTWECPVHGECLKELLYTMHDEGVWPPN